MKASQKTLAITAGIAAVFSVSVLLMYGYGDSWFAFRNSSSTIEQESPLLPDDWETYRTDVWAVGYSSDFDVVERKKDGAVLFLNDDRQTIFLIILEPQSFSEIMIEKERAGFPSPEMVTIANYSAAKYSTGIDTIDYVINHAGGVIRISSERAKSTEFETMLATFFFE